MKFTLLIIALIITSFGIAQKKDQLNLTNVMVVAQIDNPEDRYSVEINLTQMFKAVGINAVPSMNIVKMGQDATIVASDSVQQLMKDKGIDTYVLVSVRGYDRNFKISNNQPELKEALEAGSLVDLYQTDIVSISFEFKFYREGKFVQGKIVKCGNVSDRASVLKRFRNKLEKLISKKWMKKG